MKERNDGQMQFNLAARAGVAGAMTVTTLNELGKRALPESPQMDVVGERALAKSMRAVGVDPPSGRKLFAITLLGDLVSNSTYYSLVGLGNPSGAWRRGLLLGAAAGAGAALIPQRIGLGGEPNARTPMTKLLAFSWYTIAGLAAAAAVKRS